MFDDYESYQDYIARKERGRALTVQDSLVVQLVAAAMRTLDDARAKAIERRDYRLARSIADMKHRALRG